MMSHKIKPKNRFYHRYVSSKIIRSKFISSFMVGFLFVMVIYDSFTQDLPFYYILFILAGAVAGKVYQFTNRIRLNKSEKIIEFHLGVSTLIMILITFFVRYFAAARIFKAIDVIWISDAVYLFFIGIYIERIFIIIKQIDDLVYDYLMHLKENSENE